MSNTPHNPQVVVVGAGAAGLAAGKALQDAGVDVLVIEAADHIGGRCVTDTATFEMPFDRGGSWLHSAPINPLAHLAKTRGTTLHTAAWTSTRLHVSGRDFTAQEVSAYRDYQDAMWAAINRHGPETPDRAISEVMPDGAWADTARCNIPQMLGGDADVTSAHDSYLYADAEGDWLVAGGLGSFVADIHRGVPVRLNCAVHKIDYSGAGVRLATSQGDLTADHVILTVSTGVLAANTIAFVPALPDAKHDAVDQLPNGLLNKVGIEFDPKWREAVQGDMAEYHVGGDDFCSLLFGFYDSPLAVGFVAGRFAAALEKDGAGAATDFCLEALKATFGRDALRYVRRTDETAWRGNPLTLGSYSHAKPGGTSARSVLAEPVAERIYFAGEATMKETYSTVHGAFLSGQRAARDVLSHMGRHSGVDAEQEETERSNG